MKACGKSTVGKLLAKELGIEFVEVDREIEKVHLVNKKEKLKFKKIFEKYGEVYFRKLESGALIKISQEKNKKNFVLACGGGTPIEENNQKILKQLGKIFFLDANSEILLFRILKHSVPIFFNNPEDPKKSLEELLEKRISIYEKLADKKISFTNETPKELVGIIINNLKKL